MEMEIQRNYFYDLPYELRNKIYLYVQRLASEHWNKIKDPKAYVRGYYQTKLSGYKIYKCKM